MVEWYYLLILAAAGYVVGAVFGFPKISFGEKDE